MWVCPVQICTSTVEAIGGSTVRFVVIVLSQPVGVTTVTGKLPSVLTVVPSGSV